MRVVVIGSAGQLGRELLESFDPSVQVTGLTHSDVDITDPSGCSTIIRSHNPDVVINTAAFHNVDLCESESRPAYAVNTLAALDLARLCDDIGARFAHISTDYVFDGQRSAPYSEDEPVNPLSVYGASKAAGEQAVRTATRNHLIIRTAGLYGPAGMWNSTGNFVEKMIKLAEAGRQVKIVSDQVTGPTYTPDLAKVIARLVENDAAGTFHVTNSGAVSWFQFASAIFDHLNISCDFSPTDSRSFGAKAARPAYSVLSNEKQERVCEATIRPWQEALPEYLERRTRYLEEQKSTAARSA